LHGFVGQNSFFLPKEKMHVVICKICFIEEGKEKLLVPKLDILINTQGYGSA
jgi:hypothetical protein